mmetsp:Transcript_64705/g.142791  ORF Transcript_64705/g.142791 Transcript_64705/m.142791 type:complete len:352 (+) Transcript_64705:71-1126(+)
MGCGASSKKYESAASTEGGTATGATAAAPAAAPAPEPAKEKSDGLGEDDSDDGEDDVLDEAEFEAKMTQSAGKRGSRGAVCADTSVTSADWVAPVHAKTPEQEARLTASVKKSFVFAALDPKDLKVVIAAFQEIAVPVGKQVIKEGDRVGPSEQALFVIEKGQLEVYRLGTKAPVFVYDQPGQYFGDLAVLYNAPRAATVVAKTDCTLWSIDRNTFNFLVKDASRKAAEMRVAFLEKVDVLKDLDKVELTKLQECLVVREAYKDETIIKQGAEGNEFFLVESGKCEARLNGEVVHSYGPQDYFGQLALLNDAARAADVVAVETTHLLVLGKDPFKRLLGPLDELLKKRAAF